jgi:hypothetical protein
MFTLAVVFWETRNLNWVITIKNHLKKFGRERREKNIGNLLAPNLILISAEKIAEWMKLIDIWKN